MFRYFNINYNINTIYIAIVLNFMLKDEIIDYAIDLMGIYEYKDNSFINDLIFDIEKMTKFDVICGIEHTFNLYQTLDQENILNELEKIKDILFLYIGEKIEKNEFNLLIDKYTQKYFDKVEYLLEYIYDDFITIYYQLDMYFYIEDFSYDYIFENISKDLEEMEEFIYYMPKKDNNKGILESFYSYIQKIKNKYNVR